MKDERMIKVSFWAFPEDWKKLKKIARKLNMSRSELVRLIMRTITLEEAKERLKKVDLSEEDNNSLKNEKRKKRKK